MVEVRGEGHWDLVPVALVAPHYGVKVTASLKVKVMPGA